MKSHLRNLNLGVAIVTGFALIFLLTPRVQAQTSLGPHCEEVTPLSPVSSQPVGDFKAAAAGTIQNLLARHYTSFGDLNLRSFLTQISSTHVRYVPALKFYESDGNERASACWSISGSVRTVNVSLWSLARTDLAERGVIALHEFLGAAQYDDHDYGVSSAMALLASDEAYGLIEPEQIPALSGLHRKILLAEDGGGVFVTGGGGDEAASMMKLDLFKSGLDDLRRARTPRERQAAIDSMLNFANGFTVNVQWR